MSQVKTKKVLRKWEMPLTTKPECEFKWAHTVFPSDVSRKEFKKQLEKTHVVRKCKGCGLYVIWVPKELMGYKANHWGS